ncbi:hypothetical protein EXIGLDRAFT_766462 [Exidia glandulosa HHB12029]|uniref:Uncharacterized protein n=1 Tax=Exidia glandulosa HHB12029 TaxID=1314781 RepID=A0A165JQQ0_EXIGL|nr:hypothetical protein EXIGLDRAFT_766462 [Exidia glandulosa HHB12029]
MEENYGFEDDFDRWINRSPEHRTQADPRPYASARAASALLAALGHTSASASVITTIDPASARVNYLEGVSDTFAPAPFDLNATLGLGGDDYPDSGESLKRKRTLSDASIAQTQTQAATKRQRTSYATTAAPDATSHYPASTTTSSSGSSTFIPSPAQFATPPLPLQFPYVSFNFGTGPSNVFAQGPPHAGPITRSHQTAPDATPRLACERDRAQALVHAAPPAQYAAGHQYATPPSNQAPSHFNMMYPALYGDDQLQVHVGVGPAPAPAFNSFEAAVMNASSLPAQGIDSSNQSLQHGMGTHHDQNQIPPPAQVDLRTPEPDHQCTGSCCVKPKRGRGSYRTAAGSATHTHGSAQVGSSTSSNGGASTSSSPSNVSASTSPEELRVPAYDKTITPTQPQGPQRPWKVKCIFCGKAFTVTPRKNENKGQTIMRWRMDAALQHFCGRSGRPGCAYWVVCGVTSHAQPRQKRKDKGKDKAEGKGKRKGRKTQVEERVIENVDALGRGIMAVYPEMADSGFDHPQFGDVVRGGLCKWWNGVTAEVKAELTGREEEEYEDEDEEREKAEAGDDVDAEGETDDEL